MSEPTPQTSVPGAEGPPEPTAATPPGEAPQAVPAPDAPAPAASAAPGPDAASPQKPHPARLPRPGPAPLRREGPSVAGLTLRLAVLATAVSLVLIFLQMNRIGPSLGGAQPGVGGPASGAGAEPFAGSVTASVAPAAGGGAVLGTPDGSLPPGKEGEPPAPAPDQVAGDARLVRFHGLLDGVTDFEDIAQNRAYAALAEHVRRLTDAEAARILRPELDFKQLLANPAPARGEMVRADGLLVRLEPVRLAPGAGPPGVEDAWRGWLVELDGDGCYVFDFVGLPVEVSTRDVVRVEGAFLKVIRYENQGGASRDAPFLIARRAFRHAGDEAPRPFRYDYLAVTLIAAIGIGVIVQRKRAADDRTLFDARREERAGRGQKKTGSEPPRNA